MKTRGGIPAHRPPLVLLHGWGLGSRIWNELAAALAPQFQVHTPDLPGYAVGDIRAADTLEALAAHVARAAPERCMVCGWSLGGQVALAWARRAPQQVKRLALIATTPCFARRDDWPHAVAPETLEAFARAVTRDPAVTLQRFLALQAHGDMHERRVLRRLREALAARQSPDAGVLRRGLDLLQATDLRGQLQAVRAPVLVVHGACDAVTPPAAGAHLARALPDARFALMPGAAHAPFLSDLKGTVGRLAEFFDER